MELFKKFGKYLFLITILALTAVSLSACGDDEDEPDGGSSSGSGYGSVQITSVTKGTKHSAHYTYKISVKYTGSASDIKLLGFKYGKGTAMTGGGKKHTTSATKTYTGSCDLYTGNTYYFQPYAVLSNGKEITGTKKHTRVN